MANIHRRASDVRAKHLLGFSGLVVEDDRNVERDFHNATGAATHEIRITLSTPDGEDRLQFTLGGRADLDDLAVELKTGAGITDPADAAKDLVDKFNSDAARTQFAWASADGSDLVLRAPSPGSLFAFTVTGLTAPDDMGASMSTVSTGTDPSVAPFGSVIVAQPSGAESYLSLETSWGRDGSARVGEVRGVLIPSVTAQRKTITVGGVAEASKGVRAIVQLGKGPSLVVDVQSAAALADTATALASALNALPDVSASAADKVVTVTGARIGEDLSLVVFPTETQTNTYTVADANTGFAIRQPQLLGVVAYKPSMYDTKVLGEAATGVPAGEDGIILTEGYFLAKLDADISGPQHLFVGTSGSERGKLFTTSSATRVTWFRCIAEAKVRDGFTLCRLLPLS